MIQIYVTNDINTVNGINNRLQAELQATDNHYRADRVFDVLEYNGQYGMIVSNDIYARLKPGERNNIIQINKTSPWLNPRQTFSGTITSDVQEIKLDGTDRYFIPDLGGSDTITAEDVDYSYFSALKNTQMMSLVEIEQFLSEYY